jgi:Ca2+-binding RTX toxin-like protein
VAATSILGTAGADSLSATSTAGTVTSNLSNDFIVDGLSGNDTIKVLGTASAFTVKGGLGADTILFSSDINNVEMIQGGADNDTITFSKTVTNSSVFGGKGADTLKVTGTVSGSKIAGSTGADTIDLDGKVSDKSIVRGDGDSDRIDIGGRLDASTVFGGKGEDSITIAGITDGSHVIGDDGDDSITVSGTTDKTTVKGAAGNDTLVASGLGSAFFYGGADADTLQISNTGTHQLHGDTGDDYIDVTAGIASTASLFGSAGKDTIDGVNNTGKGKYYGGADADSIFGGTGAEKMYGGKGNDTINSGADGGKDTIYGDTGTDKITVSNTGANLSQVFGGADKDTISVVAAASSGGHSITGGAGADSIKFTSSSGAVDANSDVLIYSSFAEFITGGEVVDAITLNAATDGVKVNIAGGLSISATTDFKNFKTNADDAVLTGMVLQTNKSVTGNSTVILSAAASDMIGGVDTSAGTTGTSVLDASNFAVKALHLTGGAGANTIKGGDGADSLTGGAKADSIMGNGGIDNINSGAGADSLTGGSGADNFILGNVVTSGSGVTNVITDFVLGGAGDHINDMSISDIEELTGAEDFVTGAGVSINSTDPTAVLVTDFAKGGDLGGQATTHASLGALGGMTTTGLETAIEAGGAAEIQFGATEAGDTFLFLSSDGTNSGLFAVTATKAIADGQDAVSGDLVASLLVKFNGVTDSDAFVNADFDTFSA